MPPSRSPVRGHRRVYPRTMFISGGVVLLILLIVVIVLVLRR